ncbi:hypothetical protein BD410DRAFT_837348 [Rickenella mellea]|uniref:Uncharacterized protein n=1 Tax=Rickenella mellea TaxID=50990 RepID=A0A4Y7QDD4_9AGAM|nr:hypothetical protein BD410DRAFT_837348 [Rickenella mellea]
MGRKFAKALLDPRVRKLVDGESKPYLAVFRHRVRQCCGQGVHITDMRYGELNYANIGKIYDTCVEGFCTPKAVTINGSDEIRFRIIQRLWSMIPRPYLYGSRDDDGAIQISLVFFNEPDEPPIVLDVDAIRHANEMIFAFLQPKVIDVLGPSETRDQVKYDVWDWHQEVFVPYSEPSKFRSFPIADAIIVRKTGVAGMPNFEAWKPV